MKLAIGLKMPSRSRGRIRIDRQPVTRPLKICDMAFQAPGLLPRRTTVDNVLLPLEIVESNRSRFRSRNAGYTRRLACCCKASAPAAVKTNPRGSGLAACSSAPVSAAR